MPESRRTIPADRPTDFPTFEVLSDGDKLSKKYHVFSFTVSKSLNRISYAELKLKDGDPAAEDFPVSNTDLFKPGSEIELKAGYHNDNETIFKGIVVKHGVKARDGRASKLKVECKDKAVKMTSGRKNRYFSEMTDSEIFEELIGAYGLEADVESTSQSHKEMVQYYATDWDFLLARAEMKSRCVLADDGKLIVKKPSIEDPELTLTYGATILDFEAEMDARDQHKAITSSSWDYSAQEVVESEGKSRRLIRRGISARMSLPGLLGEIIFRTDTVGRCWIPNYRPGPMPPC
ncbi:MAG: hypothetical protein U5K69_28725 [Balneolaceae bacterium]|nr:hypothetical protein [Balneolaceae bacterium]